MHDFIFIILIFKEPQLYLRAQNNTQKIMNIKYGSYVSILSPLL